MGGLEDQIQRPEGSKGSLEAEIVAQMPQPLFSSLIDYCFGCWSHDTQLTLILWRFSPLVCIRLDPNLMLFSWLLGLGCGRTHLLSWLLSGRWSPVCLWNSQHGEFPSAWECVWVLGNLISNKNKSETFFFILIIWRPWVCTSETMVYSLCKRT